MEGSENPFKYIKAVGDFHNTISKVSLYLSLIMHVQICKSALQEIPRGIFSAWCDVNSSLVSLGI